MNININDHEEGCMINTKCAVMHSDGVCSGPYGKCTCQTRPKNPKHWDIKDVSYGDPDTEDGYRFADKPTDIPDMKTTDLPHEATTTIAGGKRNVISWSWEDEDDVPTDAMVNTKDLELWLLRLHNEPERWTVSEAMQALLGGK